MPIRREERARYPKDWKVISARIKARAGGQCECVGECGLHPGYRCREFDGFPARWAKGRIVLTCAHRNHQPEDCRDDNLFAACQRCHLRYDRAHHAANAARTRYLKKNGGTSLFEEASS